ncbi:3496_t:CDS:1 [Ambispora gerdemannii]|uniref:3496_t:CDS:1 n=1 Tax=Ambispora gerdemannii TaxID=144530 RepID=A0A9N9FPH6_9GLOM|nr:3496_t:CDS:1 [Ambispora gerdemannii]
MVDPHSILAWIQNYRLEEGTKPAMLVESFGAQFTLCVRENTINTLWNGDTANNYGVLKRFKNYCSQNPKTDRNVHPIPFLGCGPSTGKSRFLQEIGNIIREKARLSNDEIKCILGEAVFLNVTYGNGSAVTDFDMDIGAEASLALRILYTHFIHGNDDMSYVLFAQTARKENAKQFALPVALQAIYEYKKMKKLVIVVGIDEVNKLYDKDRTRSCNSGSVFFVPILAGTVESPPRSIITKSMHQALQLPLQLLDAFDMLLIACNLGFDEAFVYQNNLFRHALEIFYELICGEAETYEWEDIDLVEMMIILKKKLKGRYKFKEFANKITPMLANAILERSVDEDDVVDIDGHEVSYKTLKSYGILMLEPVDDEFYIRLWVWLLIKSVRNRSIYNFWDGQEIAKGIVGERKKIC